MRLIILDMLTYWKVAEYQELPKYCWYWRIARAFNVGEHIYVMKMFENNKTLIAHEVGHIHGLEHTSLLMPTIMNPCGLFRWSIASNEKGLLEEAEKLIHD